MRRSFPPPIAIGLLNVFKRNVQNHEGIVFTFEDDLASFAVSGIPVDGNRRIRNIQKPVKSLLHNITWRFGKIIFGNPEGPFQGH